MLSERKKENRNGMFTLITHPIKTYADRNWKESCKGNYFWKEDNT